MQNWLPATKSEPLVRAEGGGAVLEAAEDPRADDGAPATVGRRCGREYLVR